MTDDKLLNSYPVWLSDGSFVFEYELKAYKDGKQDFLTIVKEDGEKVKVGDLDVNAFNTYWDIYCKWDFFKVLPSGNQGGWLGEQNWVVDLLMFFGRLANELEIYRIKHRQEIKNGR